MHTMKRFSLIFSLLLFCLFTPVSSSYAQASSRFFTPTLTPIATDSATLATASADVASVSAEEKKKLDQLKKEDITKPEATEGNSEFLALFSKRPLAHLTFVNCIAYAVQYAVRMGVPANTIILILLLPFLASFIVFTRQIIGVPSLEMLVPIALSITLVSTGIPAGVILLTTILFASTISRVILKRIRIMQLPKMALSVLVVAIFVFASLTASASAGILTVRQLSIFPILLLILLSEKIVTLQLTRSPRETLIITSVTLVLGIIGFLVLSSGFIREYVLLYPEVIITLLPFNLLMGRYFGLRLTELLRFSTLRKYAN